MKRKQLLMLLGSVCLALMMVAIACSGPAPTPTPSPSPSPTATPTPTPAPSPTQEVYHWKMQHQAGAGETWLFEPFVDELREMTNGRIDIETLASSGGLVPSDEVHHALKTGVLDIAWQASWNYEDIMPMAKIEYLVGMLSPNIEESYSLFDTRTDCDNLPIGFGLTELFREAYLKEEGVYYIAPHFNDDTRLWLLEPISKLEDLKGRILLLPAIVEDTLPVGFTNSNIPCDELYTSLAAGIVEGMEWGGPACGWDMGWHEIMPYMVSRPRMIPTCTMHFVMAPDKWEALPDDLKACVEKAIESSSLYQRTCYEYRNRSKQKIMVEEYGLTVIDLGVEAEKQHMAWMVDTLEEMMQTDAASFEAGNVVLAWLKHFGHLD